jgi:hypothetical protein
MNSSEDRGKVLFFITALGVAIFLYVASSNLLMRLEHPIATEEPPLTEYPVITPTVYILHTGTAPLTVAQQLERIDRALQDSLVGSIAYNTPDEMKLGETVTIELLLNPAITPGTLATQVVESGEVVTSSIDITPRMKATLIAQDAGLIVKPLEENPEQLVSGTDTTKWTWFVTAEKSGSHKLILVIYRLINYDGKDYWREVESYKANIDVNVTLGQRIMMLDWKWVAGILITLLLIPAFWRWMDNKKK